MSKRSIRNEKAAESTLEVGNASGVSSEMSSAVDPIKQNGPLPERVVEIKQQRDTLLKHVLEHVDMLEKDPEMATLAVALKDFYAFFFDYNSYFENLENEMFSERLSLERVLSKALENTRQVWTVLSLAINQRYNPVYKYRLYKTMECAQDFSKRAKQIISKEPIIYFDKIFNITRYPYQAHPFLGIPLDRFDLDGASAMAHEFGHHVYWNNGELEQYYARMQRLRKAIAQILFKEGLPDLELETLDAVENTIKTKFEIFHTWTAWAEETFADVFGTLLVGPLFAKTAQDILIREQLGVKDDLVKNDLKHPMPLLRPMIALETLKLIAQQHDAEFRTELLNLTRILEERWQPLWELGATLTFTHEEHEHGTSPLLPTALKPFIGAIVTCMATTPLFPLQNQPEGKLVSLLESVDYWGKSWSAATIQELKNLQQQYRANMISAALPEPSGAVLAQRRSLLLSPVSPSAFGRLLSFLQSERQRQEQLSRPVTTTEWEDVLELNLMLMYGHEDQGLLASTSARHSHTLVTRHHHSGGYHFISW